MRHAGWLLLVAGLAAAPAWSQQTGGGERIAVGFEQRKGDFDYLMGEWRFTAQHAELGAGSGYWTAVRLPSGAGSHILDEYRFSWAADVSMDDGATWQREYLRIQAQRIGPARSLEPLARPRPEGP